jgi:anti-sigma-K factor RskA
MSNVDVHTLSGAYALDALSPEERETFREHLAACQACRDEVFELRQAAARMGAVQWAVPPPALRARVLEAAGRTPQLPPPAATGPAVPGGSAPSGTAESSAPEPRRRWPGLLAAAAAVVALGLGGAIGFGALDSDEPEPELVAAADRVFGAGDARTATVETANGGKLTVGISQQRNEMAVDARGLPELDREHVYQLWTVHEDTMVSAAVLTDDTTGAAMGLPEEDTQVAVTIEPAGGSEEPTTEPIATVDPETV